MVSGVGDVFGLMIDIDIFNELVNGLINQLISGGPT